MEQIKASELRVGNWIEYTNEVSGKSQFVECNIYHLADIVGGTDISDMEMQGRYSPILLTPEILLACGFKHWDNDWWFMKLGWLELSVNTVDGQLCIQPNKEPSSQLFSDKNHCTQLHHLQNVVFAHTSQELIYKPSLK